MTSILESTRPIDLYSLDTPNGQKINIALEELGLKYVPHTINITKGDQFKPEFLKVSPNNKIPALVDHVKLADGTETDISVFESVAILIYLAEKTGRADLLPSLTQDPLRRKEILEWAIWQCAGFGPMLGQMGHFFKYAAGSDKLKNLSEEERNIRLEYGKTRYLEESQRLFKVLDKQLEGKEYVCGAYSIADMAIFPWIKGVANFYGLLDQMGSIDNVKRYIATMEARPAVQRGMGKVCSFN